LPALGGRNFAARSAARSNVGDDRCAAPARGSSISEREHRLRCTGSLASTEPPPPADIAGARDDTGARLHARFSLCAQSGLAMGDDCE
jgi:hypothetical protein